MTSIGRGSAAHLGELVRAGVRVPDGCCVTTAAFALALTALPNAHVDRLSRLQADDQAAIRDVSAELRHAIETVAVPTELATAIEAQVTRLGPQRLYAVRSSATAEDLPGASFAGQHDSYLEVAGEAVLAHVRRCWASLFTERAVTYRLRNGFDHRAVQMAVVVQRMVSDSLFLDELPRFVGGIEARTAIVGFLDRYGMRCVGEIDITRPRWSEAPATLLPAVLAHVRTFEPGEAARRFEQGRLEAAEKERSVLAQLRALPGHADDAVRTQRMIHRLRTFVGYREYPKFAKICRYFAYKQAILREIDQLVAAGTMASRDDARFLRFEELHEVVRTNRVDGALVRQRREEFESYRALVPPRVMTSDGESLEGTAPRDDLPPGALVGLAVSAGTVEGRARVVTDIAQADLEPGDILVTTFTDPSWTPLFVAVAGLVTEVGGVMTHGAVIAREYGLPAVVGVDNATRLIADGQRIRVHGTDGYVEVLST